MKAPAVPQEYQEPDFIKLQSWHDVTPETLYERGHNALIDGHRPLFHFILQNCFDRASNPNTADPLSYSKVFTELEELGRTDLFTNQS